MISVLTLHLRFKKWGERRNKGGKGREGNGGEEKGREGRVSYKMSLSLITYEHMVMFIQRKGISIVSLPPSSSPFTPPFLYSLSLCLLILLSLPSPPSSPPAHPYPPITCILPILPPTPSSNILTPSHTPLFLTIHFLPFLW